MLAQIFIFLSFSVLITSFPTDCQSPEMKQKGRQCISTLQPMFDQIHAAQSSDWIGGDTAKRINDLCTVSLDCFKTLQKCAGIDTELILNMEGVCEQYKFITGNYRECLNKLGEQQKNEKCITNFFMNPVYTDAKDKKSRCDSLKNDGKCVEKKSETFCTKQLAKSFDDYLSTQKKRFDC